MKTIIETSYGHVTVDDDFGCITVAMEPCPRDNDLRIIAVNQGLPGINGPDIVLSFRKIIDAENADAMKIATDFGKNS